VTELILGDGPTRYLGGSIETFALPYAAFIVIAFGLYYIFRRPHNVPRMKYLRPAHQTSVGTREPGIADFITVSGPMRSAPAAEAETAVPREQAPQGTDTITVIDAGSPAGPAVADPATGDAGPATGDAGHESDSGHSESDA
jgi:hypothetical protein